jgi:hypothetical protein
VSISPGITRRPVDCQGSRRELGQGGTDRGDRAVSDEHVGAGQVAEVGIHGDHVAAGDE